VALRTFSSRLLGADPELVMWGGGNTSVKDQVVDLHGDFVSALFVKGSGWDLATLEPAGLTPVDLEWCRRLRALPELADEDMVDTLRTHRLRGDAPDPSIETLLHAFLPHAFVDHSHADAILGLTNRRDGARHVREALGERVVVVPYVKPGFDLSRVAADWYDSDPDCVGLVLLHHGLFTFGPTAEISYRRHVELVTAAERYLDARARTVTVPVRAPGRPERLSVALRAALYATDPQRRRWIVHHRPTELAQEPELAAWSQQGPLTPDHVIRTKPKPLYLPPDPQVLDAVEAYAAAYHEYFVRCAESGRYVELDPLPRVIWAQDVGLFTVGANVEAASAAADIALHTVRTLRRSAGLGEAVPLGERALFEMEYWSLEQKKLGKGAAAPALDRRVALITGGAGAVGVGVARQLLAAGAHVVLTDVDPEALARAVEALGRSARLTTVILDVTDAASVDQGFLAATAAYGGVDLVVVNAGVAVAGPLVGLSDEDVWRATEINYVGAMRTMRAAADLFARQQVGGDIVLVSTKNVAAPGAGFGAYSASKAAAHQLAKVAALELAPLGVRVNLVAPDAVFHEGAVASGLWAEIGPERARARGLAPEQLPAFYRERNLLRAEISGSHVGRAVVFLASGAVPLTGCVIPVDGGLPEAFLR
jgi:rhamnose utilization protein RhaD (predicted bifunctional aldolase and dehydrogenase)/NAD(P)-dependent dehydrogenase (short-subunit alcohol dehydrogenase family)